MELGHLIEVRIEVSIENPKIPSIEQIWRSGDWFERETYDMYGIKYEGHRDLRRTSRRLGRFSLKKGLSRVRSPWYHCKKD